ncbi:MAG TPA: hypothetical protein VF746_07200 [Longimicrobium sp.]|jgi:hypothetical protein
MLRSLARPRAFFPLAFLAAALAAAACQDESPTLSDPGEFPGGVPVTLEVIVPAAEFLDVLGVHTGFASRNDFAFQLAANQYGGSLNARTLLRFALPDSITFSQDGTTRVRPFAIRSARLVILADSAASAPASGSTLQLYELAQSFHLPTVSWTLAADTAPAPVPWTEPGGTRGPLLDQFAYVPGALGDSVTFQIDSVEAARVRADGHPGVLVAAGTPGTRVQFTTAALVVRARPDSAARDTTIELTVDQLQVQRTFVFTPDPPQPAGTLQAGGIFAARSVFTVDLDRTVPGCPPPQTCAALPLRDVLLNRVSLLFRPLPTPGGFEPLEAVPLTLWTVPDPELGRRAPLGFLALDPVEGLGQLRAFAPGDTLVELPITTYSAAAVRNDSLTTTFALLGEAVPSSSSPAPPRTFGPALFEAAPRLRIVYTLPTRPRLP